MRDDPNGQGGTRTALDYRPILAFPDSGAVTSAADNDRLPLTDGDRGGHPDRRAAILAAFDAGPEAIRAGLYAVATSHEQQRRAAA